MKTSCPALLIAAPASGQGKTTITAALARLHARQGRRVRVFKCGPDFLDAYWHSLASGAAVYQLDLWMTGEADCRARLAAAAAQADLILVEGVMGLFDGQPSAADLARRFGLPVLAVVDASAMAGTFGALAFGLQHYQSELPWAGVLANRVASAGHAAMLQASIPEAAHWLGAVLRSDALTLPERHLGLTLASEVPDALARLDAAADALLGTPLGRMELADMQQRWGRDFSAPSSQTAPASSGQPTRQATRQPTRQPSSQTAPASSRQPANPYTPQAATPAATPAATQATPPLQGKTIAIARDAAFCFIYQANLDCLQQLGAQLTFFSPLADQALPACDALWLPGGYPELHAQRLSNSQHTRASLAAHIAADRPVWAECGGMMALFDSLQTQDGQTLAQWALLPGSVTMQARLAALGPQQLALADGTLRGHTFHYSTTQTTMQPLTHTTRPGQPAPPAPTAPTSGEAVWQWGSVRASYFHAWFASAPAATAALFLPQKLVPQRVPQA